MSNSLIKLFETFYTCITPDMHPLFIKRCSADAQRVFWEERFLEAYNGETPDIRMQSWTELPQVWLKAWNMQQSIIDKLEVARSEDKRVLHNVIDMERKKVEELEKRINNALAMLEKHNRYIPFSAKQQIEEALQGKSH